MKQLFFKPLFLLKYKRQLQLIIIVLGFFGTKLFAQITNTNGFISVSSGPYIVVNNASFINNGTFTPGTSTVSFTGTTPYSVGTNATTPTNYTNFYNLTNTNSTTGTVNPLVTVSNILSVTTGTLACGTTTPTTNLTLLSTSTNTANVSAVGVGGAINGYVNVQRYIPPRRAWRLLTAPVSGTNTSIGTIFATWQISGALTANKGMFVTGPAATNFTPSTTNTGLDYSARNNSSMKSWSYAATTPAYTAVSTTNTGISTNKGSADNIGYFVFVRGDRNTTMSQYATANITTLNSIGILQSGTQTFSASSVGGNYTLIGNPYAAAVDFKNISASGGGLSNIAYTFYTWDATLATVGGYVTFTSTDGVSYVQSTATIASAQTTVIQSGQAFFVKTSVNGVASITFKESYKSGTVSPIAGFRPMTPSTPLNIVGSLRANLFYINTDSSLALADGNLTQFSSSYNDGIFINEDAEKFTNINENLGLLRHGTTLAIESRPNLTITDTLFLNLSRTSQRAYQFKFEPTNLDNTNLVGYLQDKYLNTSTEISLANTTPINFTVDGNAASAAVDRFQIVFKTLLPFAFTKITATKNKSDIAVEWKVANETDIVQYDVEKSTDGTTFTKVNTNLVNGNNNAANNYTWLDRNAQTGDNIYRIKMLGKDGSTKYTENVKVTIEAINTGISIYPNPIKDGKINIQMGNQPTGTYQLSITNNNGQVIYTGTVQNNSNNSIFLINLNTKAAKGMYNLQITTPQNKITTQKLIVE